MNTTDIFNSCIVNSINSGKQEAATNNLHEQQHTWTDQFSTLKLKFHNHFTNSLSCNRVNNTSSIDTVCMAGLVEDHKTLVGCLAFLSWEHTCPVSCLATLSFSSFCLLEIIFFGLFATSDVARFSGHVDTSASWTGKATVVSIGVTHYTRKFQNANFLKNFWYFICIISYSTS